MREFVERNQQIAVGNVKRFTPGTRRATWLQNQTIRALPYMPWKNVILSLATKSPGGSQRHHAGQRLSLGHAARVRRSARELSSVHPRLDGRVFTRLNNPLCQAVVVGVHQLVGLAVSLLKPLAEQVLQLGVQRI